MHTQKLNWPDLLNWGRFSESPREKFDPARSPWQADYDRIVYMAAFRRLQDKTQVFPMSESDYVRTRLTHSIEVSTVARTLGTAAGAIILDKHDKDTVMNGDERVPLRRVVRPGDIGALLAAAALAHDLGNPPFGHSGEDSVRHWFDTSPALKNVRDAMPPEQKADLHNWEGNAQGFRLLTRYKLYPNHGGMRLTYSTLAAFCKYPNRATTIDLDGVASSRKKFGFFDADSSQFAAVAKATGLLSKKNANGTVWFRHPLAFLMEAADDICYRIVDLEDGYRVGSIPYARTAKILQKIATKVSKSRLDEIPDRVDQIAFLRAAAINELVKQVTVAFAEHEPEMLTGQFDQPLTEVIDAHLVLEEIKKCMSELVYSQPGVVEIEAAGFTVIPGLLDLYWSAVTATDSQPDYRRAQKIKKLIPKVYRPNITKERNRDYYQILRIVDYVSGMTDSFALSRYKALHGISL